MTTLGRLQAEYARRASTPSDIVEWLPTLHDTAAAYPQVTVIELGVRSGNSTAAFLLAVAEVDGHLWSVDVTAPQVPASWVETGLWTLHVGDDVSQATAGALPSETDVLFIDTSHHYEHTLAELRLYVPRVKAGGTVLMHDTELERPENWHGEPYPVRRAIDDYCAEAGLTWDNRPGCYGLGVIKI